MNLNRVSQLRLRVAALSLCGVATIGVSGCGDNAPGNPDRGSISMPRNRPEGGAMEAPAVDKKGKAAAPAAK